MIIRKTIKEYKRRSNTFTANTIGHIEQHEERILKSTYWFLYIIPVYTVEEITATNL